MILCLREVYQKALYTYHIQMIAGAKGLGNSVEWVHVIEDEQVSGFLSGNELVFTTGIGHKGNAWLNEFVRGLKENNACGLVVNLGRHIDNISQTTIDFCEKNDFPLFTIPWPTKIVDMSRHICHMIIQREQLEISISNAFSNAIFAPNNESLYKSQLERYGFSSEGRYCVALLDAHDPSSLPLKNLRRLLDDAITKSGNQRYHLAALNKHFLIIGSEVEEKDFATMLEGLARSDLRFNIGLGETCTHLSELVNSFQQADFALKLAVKNGHSLLRYSELGIYKLLQMNNKGMLLSYYHEVLGVLENYDGLNGTNYMDILRLYLKQDESVQSVANLMYVHRNTINYKLKKIEEIIGMDLSLEENRVRIVLAFKILDIL